MAGPAIGGYMYFLGGQIDIAAGDAADRIAYAAQMPCAVRVMEVSWNSVNAASGTGLTIQFMANTTLSITGAATLTSVVDLDVRETAHVNGQGSGFEVMTAAGRDLARGDYLMGITNDGGGSLVDLNIVFVVFSRGYMTSDANRD
ncbi:MAG: hypothetical protein V3S43_06315 [Acidimicrobiia bacterium]